MKIGELITSIATQAGIPSTDDRLKAIQMNPELAKIDIPDDLSKAMTEKYNGMFTLESAKQNPDIKKHFFAQFADGVEAEEGTIVKDFGIDEGTYKELVKSHRLGAKRLSAMLKTVQEMEAKKAATPDPEKHKKLSDQITELNNKIVDLNSQMVAKEENFKKEKDNIYRNIKMDELFKGIKYTDKLPKNVQVITGKTLFEEEVKNNNLKVFFDPEKGELSLRTSEDTQYFKNNKPVGIKDFVESILAENNLLEVAPAKPGNGQAKAPFVMTNTGNTRDTSKFADAIATSLEEAAHES